MEPNVYYSTSGHWMRSFLACRAPVIWNALVAAGFWLNYHDYETRLLQSHSVGSYLEDASFCMNIMQSDAEQNSQQGLAQAVWKMRNCVWSLWRISTCLQPSLPVLMPIRSGTKKEENQRINTSHSFLQLLRSWVPLRSPELYPHNVINFTTQSCSCCKLLNECQWPPLPPRCGQTEAKEQWRTINQRRVARRGPLYSGSSLVFATLPQSATWKLRFWQGLISFEWDQNTGFTVFQWKVLPEGSLQPLP